MKRGTLLFFVLLSATGVAVAQKRISEAPIDRRFDHRAHEAMVKKRGIASPGCNGACHPISSGGRWQTTQKREHQRCFEACHGGFRHGYTLAKDQLRTNRGRVCLPCHGSKLKFRPKTPGPVAGLEKRHYVALYSHKTHTAPGAKNGAQCEGCHGPFGDTEPLFKGIVKKGHKLCARCHDKKARPLMTECATCHVPKRQAPPPSKRQRDPYSVSAAFSHKGHAGQRRVGKSGRDCFACHDNIAKAKRRFDVPPPTMQGCEGKCHDGQKAFAVTGPTCNRCHKSKAPAIPATPIAFRHDDHISNGANVSKCDACHSMGKNFVVSPPTSASPHKPCSDAACHASEFFSRKPTICGACHADASPWQKARKRQHRPSNAEYRTDLSHAAHVKELGGGKTSCAKCHGDVWRSKTSPMRGHAACATCHDKKNKPDMTECGGCHKQGSARKRLVSEWSVRDVFTHKSHKNDPRSPGKAPPCAVCHQNVSATKSLDNVRTPTMASCGACHNGKHAFKTTGFECYRCHTNQPRPE